MARERYRVLVHLPNEEPILGEVERLPQPQDTIIVVYHPRRRDGRDVHYLEDDVEAVVFPLSRVTLVEILPSEEEEIIGFVRE